MNTERIRVMIADAGYEMLGRQLEAYNGERFDIVCCTADGNEVYDQVLQAQPDVVLMDDDPQKIAKAIKISRKCLRIVYENIYFAIGIKVICLILGALGIANMWAAIFADVGVMVIAVLNAIRALFVKKL